MINLLRTLDLGRVVREVLVDGKGEVEDAAFVHALVGFDGQGEVEDVVGVGKGHFHRAAQGEFLKVYHRFFFFSLASLLLLFLFERGEEGTSLHPQLRGGDLLLLLSGGCVCIFSLLLLLFLFLVSNSVSR